MKIGFIGAGNMAGAIARGLVKSNAFKGDELNIFDVNEAALASLAKDTGACAFKSQSELIASSDIVLFAVKPNVLAGVLSEAKASLEKKKPLVISIAAGKPIDFIESYIGTCFSVVRVMPNINAIVLAANSGFCANENVTGEEKEWVRKIFGAIGGVTEIEEKLFSAFGVLAGCAPAYAYLYIDALARAAQKAGLPRDIALKVSAQTAFGSAKMLLESSEHPHSLIDKVCSPGGTTIEGILSLKADAFEGVLMKAFDASYEKDVSFGGK
ncbi:MAG: pyrroline-5-carboxylate reductase [Lachnospiraceae bacterium]|nr:pyrroline-5-carboxylate reductase [Lachnospiraceae bacterium]